MNELHLLAIGPRIGDFSNLTRKQKRRLLRFCRTRRWGANLVVDLGNTTDHMTSLVTLSGTDTVVGTIVDMLHADTNTQVFIASTHGLSGPLPIVIQTSDSTASGDFTNPTSGLPSFPADKIASGGMFWANSGLYASGNSSPQSRLDNAPILCSGGIQFAHFQRPGRYARLILTSGNAAVEKAIIVGGFIGQKRVTGSGGGFSYSPGSGSVNV